MGVEFRLTVFRNLCFRRAARLKIILKVSKYVNADDIL